MDSPAPHPPGSDLFDGGPFDALPQSRKLALLLGPVSDRRGQTSDAQWRGVLQHGLADFDPWVKAVAQLLSPSDETALLSYDPADCPVLWRTKAEVAAVAAAHPSALVSRCSRYLTVAQPLRPPPANPHFDLRQDGVTDKTGGGSTTLDNRTDDASVRGGATSPGFEVLESPEHGFVDKPPEPVHCQPQSPVPAFDASGTPPAADIPVEGQPANSADEGAHRPRPPPEVVPQPAPATPSRPPAAKRPWEPDHVPVFGRRAKDQDAHGPRKMKTLDRAQILEAVQQAEVTQKKRPPAPASAPSKPRPAKRAAAPNLETSTNPPPDPKSFGLPASGGPATGILPPSSDFPGQAPHVPPVPPPPFFLPVQPGTSQGLPFPPALGMPPLWPPIPPDLLGQLPLGLMPPIGAAPPVPPVPALDASLTFPPFPSTAFLSFPLFPTIPGLPPFNPFAPPAASTPSESPHVCMADNRPHIPKT